MTTVLAVSLLILSLLGSFLFATLSYSLRDFSRATLAELASRKSRRRGDDETAGASPARIASIIEWEEEYALTAAGARAACNLGLVLCVLHLMPPIGEALWTRYLVVFLASLIAVLIVGVAIPQAVSRHAAEAFINFFAPLLRVKRLALLPFVKLHTPLDVAVRRMSGSGSADDKEHVEEEIEKEILDIVAEGSEEGVIDESERQMIERTIRFQDTTAEDAMTSRSDIVAVAAATPVEEMLAAIEESGHSRIPVYDGTLDNIVGILYARDLFRYAGKTLNGHTSDDGRVQKFDLDAVTRQPLVVPETKRLADLLRDMQLQKIHMAIVLDEYGGTAGIVTIEDILEELVGEIEDEYDDDEAPRFERKGDAAAEADARVEIGEVNRLLGLKLPTDDGYDTLGGFVTTQMGEIPKVGERFEYTPEDGPPSRFVVLEAEPQRVTRVRIELGEVGAMV